MRFLILAAWLAASSTQAMMPPGPSPESGLAGIWRVVAAQSAPWAKPRKLTKADAPLLEYAVAFADNEVKGPPALACKGARYSSGVTYQYGLFGGKLANARGEAMAAALALTNPPTTFQVFCGPAVREYYINDHADMELAIGDVVYTLQRPTGMEPDQYKPGFTGPGFDCTRAKTTSERLICTDAALAKSDARLTAAYRKLRASLSPDSFATFQVGQRAWLAFEMKSCGANVPWPAAAGDQSPIVECLQTVFDDRGELLEGLPAAHAGALLLEPRLRSSMRSAPDTEESDIYPYMSGGPAASPFNTYIARALGLARWRMNDKALFQYDDTGDMKLHAHRSYAVARFDGRVVSLEIGTSDYTGGHDEERGSASLNWNVAKAMPFGVDDVLAGDWRKFVLAICEKDLQRRLKADEKPADLTVSDLKETLANSARWLWGKDKATIMFTVFMDSGMPQERYDVEIPYRALKPFLKPTAPVL